jgi:protein-disulfide isomerase
LLKQLLLSGEIMNKKLVVITLLLALAGLVFSVLLAKVSIGLATNPDYESFCNFGTSYNCEAVAMSKYAAHFGIPNFVFGILYYAALLLFGLYILMDKINRVPHFFPYLFWLSVVSVGVSVYLFAASVFIIKSTCVLCMLIYVTNFLFCFVALKAEQWSFGSMVSTMSADIKKLFASPLRVAGIVALAVVAAGVLFYFKSHPLLDLSGNAIDLSKSVTVEYAETSADRLVTGTTDKPEFTIMEFTDFECPFCAKAGQEMKKVLLNNPNVRLIFKDYPLDSACNEKITKPFHRSACRAALYARCAAEQGRFWEYHDILFGNQSALDKASLESYASEVGLDMSKFRECAESHRHRDKIAADIEEAYALGVGGTPTFFINGHRIGGFRTAEQFEQIMEKIRKLEEEAARQRKR